MVCVFNVNVSVKNDAVCILFEPSHATPGVLYRVWRGLEPLSLD